jgi:anti-anti-sigma factor
MSDLDAQSIAFEITERRDAEQTTLELVGELDLAVVDSVRAALSSAKDDAPSRVLVDISGLTFMDSSGLALLVEARQAAAAAGREFVITQPRGQVRKLFQLTGMLDGFVLHAAD